LEVGDLAVFIYCYYTKTVLSGYEKNYRFTSRNCYLLPLTGAPDVNNTYQNFYSLPLTGARDVTNTYQNCFKRQLADAGDVTKELPLYMYLPKLLYTSTNMC
jgi:hypothetical protein